MALFQEAIVKKHLNDLDAQVLDNAYNEYLKVYSTEKIKNIRIAKEEQYQEGFLKDIFGSVLGYSVYPESPYNIETEKKNESNAKKADGAILKDEKVVGVIELKDNKTKNLDAVKDQAFGYKNNHKECSYVISSNFHKLRFYIDDATEYEEFDLYNLDKDTFRRFYLYLRKEGLLDKNLPKLLRQETKFHEEEISKKLYKDYSNFKRSFFENAVKNNLKFDKLELFKKSQKFLDRILFLLFAEDKGLVGTNSIVNIVEKWSNADDDYYQPLYEMVTKFFGHLYNGFIYQKTGEEIPQFGGELFAPDEVLDQLRIDDEVLKNDLLVLSKYDFNTDVDVNILGHIFEHSLNEVDDVEAELRGEQLDKTKSKRKKDGVFYTPKYITKYIVDNTLGKLCSEKKAELKLDQDLAIHEYQKADGKLNEKGKVLFKELNNYKSWLLTVKVCDPACGSGAFLNQALSYFIEEHKQIDDIIAELTNTPMRLFDTDLQILENNIFGVDINEESVEIAKLSMWLRTAQPGRKLSDLSNNIKCGNSLIDDPEVAGDKAFKWQKEFPTVFIEKNKFAFHITTCLHDSRTSSRMVEYKVRERRFDGSKPNAEVNPLTKEEEELIATIVSEIAKEDNLNIAAFNLCKDHMHILLICEEEEISSIMQKIKAKTARAVNIHRGSTKILAPHNKGACSLDETQGETSPNKGAGSLDDVHGEASHNKGACSLDEKDSACSLDDRNILHTLDSPRGEKQNSLWTQKFGCKPVTSDEQFWNTFHYIENNKEKHNLPRNPKLETIIGGFVKTYEECLKTEHTGGFDVVIGNPPYVKLETIRETSVALENMNYQTFDKRGDLYVLFVEKGFEIVKENGFVSYIIPNKWLQAGYGEKLRKYLLTKELNQLIDFGDIQIFEGATTYPVIFTAVNTEPSKTFEAALLKKELMFDFHNNVKINSNTFETAKFNGGTWIISSGLNNSLLERLSKQFKTLKVYVKGEALRGILNGLSEAFIVEEEIINENIKNDKNSTQFIKKFVQGRDIQRYGSCSSNNSMIIIEKGYTHINIGVFDEEIAFVEMEKRFSGLMSWLEPFKENARKRTDKGDYWWELRACDYYADFLKPKIMYQVFQVSPCFIYDESGLYCNNSMWILPTDNRALLGVLNSKMGWWLTKKYCTQIQNGCQLIWKQFGQIPIPETTSDLNEQVDRMLLLQKHFQTQTQKLSSYIISQNHLEKISSKLSNWHELSFTDFIKALNKAIKTAKGTPLSKKDEFEWMELFEENKKKALKLKSQIDQTDAAIDRMVYELYGLTEEEIQIVENS